MILRALRETDGHAVAVPEREIAAHCDGLARQEGLVAGPEGGAALLALADLSRQGTIAAGERVVVFQTGDPANYASA